MDSSSDGELGDNVEGADLSREELESTVAVKTAQLQGIMDAIAEVLLKLDRAGRIEFANQAVEEILGYSQQELIGAEIGMLLAERAMEWEGVEPVSTAEFLQTLNDEGRMTEFEVPFTTVEGNVVPMSLSTALMEDSESLVCVATDISNRKERERELKQYTELVQAVGDPMYVLDADGYIEKINDAMVEYTGYARDELVGRSLGEIIPSKEYEKTTEIIARLVESPDENSEIFETMVVTKGGELLRSEAKVTVVTDSKDRYTGSVAVLRDIQDRKQRERDLALLKQVLTRVFRHNIRNELMIVRGHAEILEDTVECLIDSDTADDTASSDVTKHTEQIIETAQRVLDHGKKVNLIEQVLESNETKEVDLSQTVDWVVESADETYPAAAIDVDMPDTKTVEAHPRIAHAIEELIDNAIQHTPEDREPAVSIWTDDGRESTTLFVEDNAGGLSEQEITVLRRGAEDKLEHGTGVGLWLVRWLVDRSDAALIAQQTTDGSLMGIRFLQPDSARAHSAEMVDQSPVVEDPEHLQSPSPARRHGETVVGRVETLHQLEDIYDALSRKGGQAVFLSGETGIGKTTLVEQFRTRLLETAEAPLVTTGRCEAGITPPYHAFRQALADLPLPTETEQLFDDVSRLTHADPETVQRRRQALFADIAAELRELVVDQPVVLVLEDLQWADRATIDLFKYLIDEIGQWAMPILFVGTYRSEAAGENHPVAVLTEQTVATDRGQHIRLSSFDLTEVENLLTYMLDISNVPTSFVEAVHSHTGGNPMFVKEIGRYLAERLDGEPTATALPTDLADISLPESVESAVTDRVRELVQPVQSVLQLGAVIGETISMAVLRAATDLPDSELEEYVDTLVRKRLWQRTDGRIEFVHGLIREKALQTIDADRRTTLHAKAAAAIEAVYAETIETQYGRLATHYHEANDSETAIEYYRRAGDRAVEKHAHEAALDHYEQLLEIANEHDEQTVRTAGLGLAEISLASSDYEQAREYVTFVRERVREETTAETENTHTHRRKAARLAADIAIQCGDFEQAIEEATAGLELGANRDVIQCQLLAAKAEAEWRQSYYGPAEETSKQFRELASALGRTDLEATASELLGKVYQERSEYDTATAHYEQALTEAREAGDRHRVADIHTGLGIIAFRRGNLERAETQYQQALERYETVGDHHQAAKLYNNLANVASGNADSDKARRYYRQTLETADSVGDTDLAAVARFNLGSLLRQHSEFDTARERIEEALQTWQKMGNEHRMAIAMSDLGHHLIQTGDYDEADEYLEQALEIMADVGDNYRRAKVLHSRGTLARKRGRYERAKTQYQQAMDAAEAVDNQPLIARLSADLGRLAYLRHDDETAIERSRAAIETLETEGSNAERAETLCTLGLATARAGDSEQGADYLDRALEQYQRADSSHGIALVQLARGRLALDDDEYDRARAAFETALPTLESTGLAHDAALARRGLGIANAQTGSSQTAREYLEKALDTFHEIGAVADALETVEQRRDIWELTTSEDTQSDQSREEWTREWCQLLRERVGEVVEETLLDQLDALDPDCEPAEKRP